MKNIFILDSNYKPLLIIDNLAALRHVSSISAVKVKRKSAP
jgi:hypothetical protein